MKIGIIGAGTMGNGIAHVCAINQNDVVLVDLKKSFLDRAIAQIKINLDRQLAKGIINSQLMSLAIDNIELSTKITDLKDCDLIIEAVKEDIEVKSKIFKELDSICNSKTILASNTSSISINQLSNNTKRPEKFIGMHFMNPVPVMKLVEIIKGDYTSKETLETIKNLAKKMNKIPIECNDSPGFVSNRILMPLINEAAFTYMEGVASVEAIDEIMKLGMGHPMGPLKLADLIGIDVCVSIMKVLLDGFNNDKYLICPLLIEMNKKGKLGIKTKEGFYKY
tara:strand:+ start:1939 stop:2778 length:840 start_codon:yes stop_codon:yes gene_type:complete